MASVGQGCVAQWPKCRDGRLACDLFCWEGASDRQWLASRKQRFFLQSSKLLFRNLQAALFFIYISLQSLELGSQFSFSLRCLLTCQLYL